MLRSIRKSTDSIITTGLILLIVAVMAFVGFGKLDSDSRGGGVAAWVNGEPVTNREFQQELEFRLEQYRSMLGAQFDERLLDTFQIPQRTLDELVQYKLLAQQAKKMGFRIADEELAEQIRSYPYFQKNGKFDAETYSKLPNRGSEERRQRNMMLVTRFREYLVGRVKLPPREITESVEMRETKVDLEYAKVDLEAAATKLHASSADAAAYAKKAPETELRAYYDSHRKEFTQPGTVELSQIRVAVPFKANDAAKAESRKKIDAIAKEVKPDTFAEVAKKKSDDEHAKKGGMVGIVRRGTLEPNLEKAIDTLTVGQISAPIETAFGYYLILIKNKKAESLAPFEEVKKTIAETLATEQMRKEFSSTRKVELEKILAAGKPLEPELKRMGSEIKKTGAFSLGQGYIPNIGQVDSILDAIFQLSPKNPIAPKLFEHQGALYYVKLKSVERPKPADLDKNRDAAEKALETSLQSTLVTQWIDSIKKQSTIKTTKSFDKGNKQPSTASL